MFIEDKKHEEKGEGGTRIAEFTLHVSARRSKEGKRDTGE